jgi:hypothetical protein
MCAVLLVACGVAHADDVTALLNTADRFRLQSDASRVEVQVQLYKNEQLDRERSYAVYTKPGRRSLVLFKTASEQGQKVLMLDDQFWIILPSSQRPLRITPMQKLLGEASTGDVATMTWSEDYAGTVNGDADVDGVPCLRLDLTSQRKGTTYARIELYLARDDHRPVRADLYVASGKLAKQATYTVEARNGRRQVTAMTLVDAIQSGQRTVIRYLDATPKTLPDEVFNPMFLVRNDVVE